MQFKNFGITRSGISSILTDLKTLFYNLVKTKIKLYETPIDRTLQNQLNEGSNNSVQAIVAN